MENAFVMNYDQEGKTVVETKNELYMSYTSSDFAHLIYDNKIDYDYEGPINRDILDKVKIKSYKSTLDGIIHLLDGLKDKSITSLVIKYYPASSSELKSMYSHVTEITLESAHTFNEIEDILLRFPNLKTCKIVSSLSKEIGISDLSLILPKINFIF